MAPNIEEIKSRLKGGSENEDALYDLQARQVRFQDELNEDHHKSTRKTIGRYILGSTLGLAVLGSLLFTVNYGTNAAFRNEVGKYMGKVNGALSEISSTITDTNTKVGGLETTMNESVVPALERIEGAVVPKNIDATLKINGDGVSEFVYDQQNNELQRNGSTMRCDVYVPQFNISFMKAVESGKFSKFGTSNDIKDGMRIANQCINDKGVNRPTYNVEVLSDRYLGGSQ